MKRKNNATTVVAGHPSEGGQKAGDGGMALGLFPVGVQDIAFESFRSGVKGKRDPVLSAAGDVEITDFVPA